MPVQNFGHYFGDYFRFQAQEIMQYMIPTCLGKVYQADHTGLRLDENI